MTEFIPPFPERHEKPLGPLDILKHARRDLLSIWTEKNFHSQFIETKIINRSIFIANCPDVVQHISVTNAANYGKQNPLMRKVLAPLLGNELFDNEGEIWQKPADLGASFFSSEYAARHSEMIVKMAEKQTQQWGTLKPGQEINVLPAMSQLTAEIICQIFFGNQQSSSQVAQLAASFSQYQSAIEKMDISSFLGLPGWLPTLGGNHSAKAAKNIHQLMDSLITQGEKSNHQGTLLAHLLTLRDEAHPNGLSAKQIRNELMVLFMAGHETMANTLAWAWYLISQSADVEQRLHQEVDSVLDSRSANFSDLKKLPLTRAIIDETLRLYPPIPILSRKASAEDTIRNRHIPTGSIILVVPWLLHRHKLYWHKPDHFIPDRFLDNAPKTSNEFSYLPFSASPRESFANFFGTTAATLSLAVLAKQFRLVLPEGQTVSHECRLILRPKNNLPMQLYVR